nr:MAG TPA: hypothetical protein [Caudoviricetes sp.]
MISVTCLDISVTACYVTSVTGITRHRLDNLIPLLQYLVITDRESPDGLRGGTNGYQPYSSRSDNECIRESY